ncbi:ABC transporter ATP-binding protein [Dethiobacter alkaliphilus]|uniref:ABC transporter ATP-binding protein n=1 Tax=Dethiobacter alkaliphilus TaxID=427926 RepID=UPI0022278AB9|nr:ATP-binding cassette domain-containing protein [Dethiobacter alkaliphilus]MCW3489729.1 ATP-binding cassette domain-containing protein [Dethiobacter alkaliphilus]
MKELLKVENVCKDFGKVRVVDNVGFSVRKGEVLGLLGPNGAGKTTIIRCIMGIIRPDTGKISFYAGNGSAKATSYLPEERGLYKDVPVMDIFIYLARLRRYPLDKARKRALEYLEKLNLSGVENRKVEELSKGMAQKVQFIGAILHEPELLILDEPFSGLDPVSQDVILEEILELSRRGTAILLSAHQMNLVEEICDRIFFINKGKGVLYGDLQEIKEQFADFKCEIVARNPELDLTSLQSVKRVDQDRNKSIIYMEKDASPIELLRELPSELNIQELHVDRISLHDIFVEVTAGGTENAR